ncbi:MAG: QueT transporter family protein [Clostridia bacterium]|nr:QueT transporter family protein [Clostridia bacterium]
MKQNNATKRLCRAGVIAALYVALTYAFMPFAFGPFQLRPAEALCILPLFFPEAIPALYVGCMISNLTSPYLLYDVLIGSLTTLIAALGTYFVGRMIKKDLPKLLIGGVFPVLCNAFIIPLIIVFLCGGAEGYASAGVAYTTFFFSLFLTEAVWVYALGIPLYYGIARLRKRNLAFFE